jgi:FAD/FMN-containing dehydrogenase
LPVTPGTKFVTLGGAIASDVHGKNHHWRGTFGCHVRAFELLRSNGERRTCSATQEAGWFNATIGGLGLTGLITWVELQLIPIRSDHIDMEVVRFASLHEFKELAQNSDVNYEYSVAWIDSLATGSSLGRGVFVRGNHATPEEPTLTAGPPPRIKIPFTPALTLINRSSLQLLNAVYYRVHSRSIRRKLMHYENFFYPLDRVLDWNRLYGPHGLLQHQSVVPFPSGIPAVYEMLARTIKAKLGSFLTVLKVFGNVASPGLLSFPRPGITLTLDFPNQGPRTFRLLDELDKVTLAMGGAVNPCKDARMSAENFQAFFPRWREFAAFVDPMFSSSLWRRVSPER